MTIFDLNIEEVLSDWSVVDAVREIIANALDEQKLSASDEISIVEKREGEYWIIDYGRGLMIDHLTMNENLEKADTHIPVIGKFGVGLKDALATLHRNGIGVEIVSMHGKFTLVEESKQGFSDIETLHIDFDATETIEIGTEVKLIEIDGDDINDARQLFLELSNYNILETMSSGAIIDPGPDNTPAVFIHGVRVNEEPDFMFSYNISNLSRSLRAALNRERTNVSRTAYGSTLRALILEARSDAVLEELAADIKRREYGNGYYEVKKWADVAVFAMERLASTESIVAVTKDELEFANSQMDDMRVEGTIPILIKGSELKRIKELKKTGFCKIKLLADWVVEDNKKYQLDPIDPSELNSDERNIYDNWTKILEILEIKENDRPEIIISKTTRPPKNKGESGVSFMTQVVGYYSRLEDRVVIHRNQLSSLKAFAGTLIHEIAHRQSGRPDIDRGFEMKLTHYLGRVAQKALDS